MKGFVELFWLPENVSICKKRSKSHYELLEHITSHSRRDGVFSWGGSKGMLVVECKMIQYKRELQMELSLQFLETVIIKF